MPGFIPGIVFIIIGIKMSDKRTHSDDRRSDDRRNADRRINNLSVEIDRRDEGDRRQDERRSEKERRS